MSPSSLLLFSSTLVLFITGFPYAAKSEGDGNNYGDGSTVPSPAACNNCTICQYPCHAQPPPPPSGYEPSAPPPPPPVEQAPCPPANPVICCGGGGGGGQTYAPPTSFYYPYNNYSSASAAPLQPSARMKPCSFYASTWLVVLSFIVFCN